MSMEKNFEKLLNSPLKGLHTYLNEHTCNKSGLALLDHDFCATVYANMAVGIQLAERVLDDPSISDALREDTQFFLDMSSRAFKIVEYTLQSFEAAKEKQDSEQTPLTMSLREAFDEFTKQMGGED